MAARIARLAPEVVARIAAGEVVERPASVVKELVENALDAGARRIEVDLVQGGRRLIRVRDDGCGMSPEDAQLAVERHATSKIRSLDDLRALKTLGFRGEALPSIAAVSRLEILTREPDGPHGFMLRVEAGRVTSAGPAPAPPGTAVTVRDLFFNVPARRRHLRAPSTELERILTLLTALALGHAGVALRCDHEGRTLLRTSGSGDPLAAAAEVYGAATARALVPVEAARSGMRVRGFVGAPWLARGDRSEQHVLVNGRPVQSAGIRRALEEPFRHLLPVHRHPLAALLLEVPPEAVDANVHPSKLEVRFADEEAVYRLVRDAVAEALASARLIAPLGRGPWRVAEARAPFPAECTGAEEARAERGAVRGEVAPRPEDQAGHSRGAPAAVSTGEAGLAAGAARRLPALQVLGVVDDTFVVAQGPDGLYIVDQHAAHERVVFEQLLRAGQAGPIPSQRLAVPVPVELSPAERAAWEAARTTLEAYGFVAEPFGRSALLLRAVPALLGGPDGEAGFRTALAALARGALAAGREAAPADLAADLARRILASCKAAVKAHDRLSREEVEALLQQLAAAREPWTCPHGRPTVLRLSVHDLARHFARQ